LLLLLLLEGVLMLPWLRRHFSSGRGYLDVALEASKPKSEITIAMAMSGGVDSSVSAMLLKDAGYNVKGVYMNNWDEKEEHGACQGEVDFNYGEY